MPENDRFIPLSHHPAGLEEDRLGRTPYAETIYQTLKDIEPQNSGLTIGIFGDWGSGKSSILKMTHEKIEKDADFLPVWFEAWRFAKQEELWLALLREILKEIPNKEGVGTLIKVNYYLLKSNLKGHKLLRLIGDLVSFVVSSLMGRINIPLPPGPDTSFFLQLGFDRGQSIAVREFLQDFQTILQVLDKRVVVLIDDLDRCANNQIVPVLEAIKHLGFDQPLVKSKPFSFEQWLNTGINSLTNRFLGINIYTRQQVESDDLLTGIAFVLAADRRAVLQAVRTHYEGYYHFDQRNAEDFAREYLEKIVQLPYVLPPLRRIQLEQLLGDGNTIIGGNSDG